MEERSIRPLLQFLYIYFLFVLFVLFCSFLKKVFYNHGGMVL